METDSSKLTIDDEVPAGSQNLIWNVFFASRQRGSSMSAHFPWLMNRELSTCISIQKMQTSGDGETVAAMVLKKVDLGLPGPAGLIGLVCVRDDYRGRGLSSVMLRRTIELARSRAFAVLVLWTSKPAVYAPHGFAIDSHELFCEVSLSKPTNSPKVCYTTQYCETATENDARGLPPFGSAVRVCMSAKSTISVITTPHGDCLAEWRGEPADVLALLESALPTKWTLNVPEGSPILALLEKAGYSVVRTPASYRMILPLIHTASMEVPHINVLDRI